MTFEVKDEAIGIYPIALLDNNFSTFLCSQGDEDDKAGHVISLGSFSTIFAPGLRLGWIEAPQNIIQTLIDSPFIKYTGAPQHYMSAIIESALDLGSLEGPFASLRVTYHSRMNCLCKALKEHIPRANFTQPKGGLFVWAKLPQNINTKELLLACKSKFKVDFEPGRVFSAGGDWNNYLRLSLSHYGEESLVKSVRRISEALMEIT
ncbi:predicted protein [Nematostella vectensis]|uniref:Aminotransferase class I/classII large domain-containing protein n=1 Tax=Nematostella vectensis TaxID=45351 RepID=A7SNC9_NEMVE|nr:predicted protein [Nematostella vectensis]|eukprot:XP_001626875.1 predicted protein [Nematostella vectensis]